MPHLAHLVQSFFDPATGTLSHVLHQGVGSACAVIDPVLDYEAESGRTSTASADRLVAFIRQQQLRLQWILETHAHADHLSAASYLKKQLGGAIGIGDQIGRVQGVFKKYLNLEGDFKIDGSQFDALFAEGERFQVGTLDLSVMHLPGHTPACVAYRVHSAQEGQETQEAQETDGVADVVFVGDTLFAPDLGTARCDFPGGDARVFYASIQRLLALPPDTQLYLCHDYPPNGRAVRVCTTVAEQSQSNIHVRTGVSADDFVCMRTQRDATLGLPHLIWPSVQINIRAGALPPAEDNGVSYLKTPLNAL